MGGLPSVTFNDISIVRMENVLIPSFIADL